MSKVANLIKIHTHKSNDSSVRPVDIKQSNQKDIREATVAINDHSGLEQSNEVEAPEYIKHKQSLEAAFKYFNDTSDQLSSSYRLLEKKIKQLSKDLDQAEAEKEAEHSAKHKVEHRLQALLDFLPGGVILLDAKGCIIESNPAANTLLDIELNGKFWRNVIATCFAPKNDDGLEVSTHSGRRISIATSSIDNNASGLATSQLNSVNEGQIILLTDQTETRKLQENLNRNERLSAMGKMVSALAHQIRTPLSAAMLYAGHLCTSELDEDQQTNFSQKIYARLNHMEKQVRDMMLFVKSELPLNDQITIDDLEKGLKEACEVPFLNTKSGCFFNNEASGLILKCHREALISALMNLVNNSLQSRQGSSKEAVEITISFKTETLNSNQKYLIITLQDNGPGMTEEQLLKAQECFYTSKPQGTGLGIAVVQSVARAHGAAFKLSSCVGEGTKSSLKFYLN